MSVISLVLLQLRPQLRTYVREISWNIRVKWLERVRGCLEQVQHRDTRKDLQDPGVTRGLLVNTKVNTTHKCLITYSGRSGLYWKAHHTIICYVDVLRASQCTLHNTVLDRWRYVLPFTF